MSRFDLIIFDCDGVLVDSEFLAAQVESRLLSEAGYPITAGEIGERFSGLTWRDILLTVEKEAEIPLQANLIEQHKPILDERLKRELRREKLQGMQREEFMRELTREPRGYRHICRCVVCPLQILI